MEIQPTEDERMAGLKSVKILITKQMPVPIMRIRRVESLLLLGTVDEWGQRAMQDSLEYHKSHFTSRYDSY